MRAAFLSTRKREGRDGRHLRADAELTAPGASIPRMERRVLGSIYGSARPDRDFRSSTPTGAGGRRLDRLIHTGCRWTSRRRHDAVRSGDANAGVLPRGWT
jgi:hypothetical protein